MDQLEQESVYLTSLPYWNLKEYRDSAGQLAHTENYDEFLAELDKVWDHCFRALVPGGRLICMVGDVCLRKPGPYRAPDIATRVLSVSSESDHKEWLQQIWEGSPVALTRPPCTLSCQTRRTPDPDV